MDSLLQDVRYAIRTLAKRPGFIAVAIVTLALGIGANSALFSVVNGVLLRPLAYKEPDRLVMVWANLFRPGLEQSVASVPEFFDYKEQSQAFEQIAAYGWRGFNVTGGGEPERVVGARVSATLLPLLGVEPIAGRAFLEEEDFPGRDAVAVISYKLWQRRFAGDPNAVGQTVTLDGEPCTIVGVMPEGFEFPFKYIDVWKPAAFTDEEKDETERGSHFLTVIARLKPGLTLASAQSDLGAVAGRMADQHKDDYPNGFGINLVSLHEQTVGEIRPALLVLLAAVCFVLLIACANVANLLLVRASSRQKEIAIRMALGASRARIIRQLLTESLLLSLLGATAGLLLALWGVDLMVAIAPADIPRVKEIAVDGRVFGFALAISFATGLIFGLAPALQASRPNMNEALKEGGRSSTDGLRRQRLRNLLVVAEVGLALVLLIGAGLMIKSFSRLQRIDPGFDAENLLTLRVPLPQEKYPEPRQKRSFFTDLLGRVNSLPGVVSVAAVTYLPLSGSMNDRSFSVENLPGAGGLPGETLPGADYVGISANYFEVMGTRLLKGRAFTEADSREPAGAIVNESLARRFFGEQEPVGRRIRLGDYQSPFPWMTIVGVVGDIRHHGLDAEAKPTIYVPYLQPRLPAFAVGSMFLAVRTSAAPTSLVAAIRSEVAAIDKDQPLTNIDTMENRLAEAVAGRRFNMLLLAIFAVLALALAAVGIYGVMSYSVSERTHEIGIRMALGAQTRDVFSLVVGRGMALVSLGIAIGLAAAFALTRLMSSLLYDVSATDPATYALITLVLASVALVATYLPARRAARVDPMVALRYE